MYVHASRAVLLGSALLLVACQRSLPTAPSEVTSGITVYEHANFLGQSALITQSIRDLKDFKGPCRETTFNGTYTETTEDWDDCISSIRVAPGWRATVYRDDDFDGDRLDVSQDIPNLQLVTGRCDKGGFNDCVTSIRVFAP